MWLETAVAVAVALGVSLGLTRGMLTLGPRLGLMDEPGERRIHSSAIPRAGGIAIWLTFLLVIGGGLATGWLQSHSVSLSWSWLGAFAAGSVSPVCDFDGRAGFGLDREARRLKLLDHPRHARRGVILHMAHIGLHHIEPVLRHHLAELVHALGIPLDGLPPIRRPVPRRAGRGNLMSGMTVMAATRPVSRMPIDNS